MTRPLTTRLIKPVAALIAASLLAAPVLLLAPAEAKIPEGSHAEVILETKDATGQPWNASLEGWWGHEGGKDDSGKRPTFLSLDASDGKGVVDDATLASLHKKLDDGGSFDTLRVAFVPYSADGSNERPEVHKGENAGEAFAWFADLGFGSGLNGTTRPNDSVDWVSTLDEYSKWWDAGRPVQNFTNQLKVVDVSDSGATHPAATPEGASILNRWPAGTKISLVFYVSDGVDEKITQLPTVKVGPDGHALTAWLSFETVASPTHSARTSGGYMVLTGAGTGPGVAAKPKKTGGDQAGGTSSGSTSAADPQQASSKSSTRSDASDGGFTGSLPGGRPTFWVLLILVVGGAITAITLKMRSSAAS